MKLNSVSHPWPKLLELLQHWWRREMLPGAVLFQL